jgi:hypothetical protein
MRNIRKKDTGVFGTTLKQWIIFALLISGLIASAAD